jgi:hypothetical protein
MAMIASPCSAGMVLDQEYDFASGVTVIYSPEITKQQGITPGITGRLDQIDLYIPSSNGDRRFRMSLNHGGPWQSDPDDATFTVTAPSMPFKILPIDVSSANFMVVAGEPFVLELRHSVQ